MCPSEYLKTPTLTFCMFFVKRKLMPFSYLNVKVQKFLNCNLRLKTNQDIQMKKSERIRACIFC